jgi:GWxTD domain-containing protein
MKKCCLSLCTFLLAALAAGVVLDFSVTPASARQNGAQTPAPSDQPEAKSKVKQKSNNALYKELDSPYRKWLDEDVVYIITSEERNAFLHLQTNEEREQFIEAFWQRRNPDPDSPDNSFKDEHYRRIAYTNEHFASGVPGWKTDRGRIYIAWGAPDEKEEHTAGDQWERPMDQGGGETSTYAYEDWTYHYLEGYGGASKENVEFEFVDPTGTGEFHLTSDPSEKDALLYVPNAGLTQNEALGLASKTQRFQDTDGTHMAESGFQRESLNEFTRLQNFAAAFAPPPVKFKDLQEDASSRLVRDQLKFDYRLDFLRITSDTVLVPITVQMPRKQMTFVEKSSVDTATVNLFGRVSSLSGRVIQTFEDTMSAEVPAAIIQKSLASSEIYQKAVPLSPGLYRLDLVLKDVNSGNVGVVNARLAVPRFQDDQLSASSLILADQITRVSSKDIGLGQFVLGDMKVRPKMDQAFFASGTMGIFLQVYNLKVDDKNHKADASVQYRVIKDKDAAPILTFDLPPNRMPTHGEEMTLQDALTLGSLAPGKYKLQIAVTDNLAKQTITPTADFTVQAEPAAANSTQGR